MTHREFRLNRKVRTSVTPVPLTVDVDLSELNKADLKALAANRGLSGSGTKAELIARLEE